MSYGYRPHSALCLGLVVIWGIVSAVVDPLDPDAAVISGEAHMHRQRVADSYQAGGRTPLNYKLYTLEISRR